MDKNRTTRIALRCTPTELVNINRLAASLGLDTAVFIRQAIVIAATKAKLQPSWRNAYYNAIGSENCVFPWKD